MPSPSSPSPAQSPLSVPAFRSLLLGQVSFGLAYSTFLILPKHLATHAKAGPSAIGWVMASAPIANVLGAPLTARLVARVGQRRALVLANLLMAAGAFAFALVDTIGPLAFLARALEGFAWALVFSAGYAAAARVAPPARLAEALALHGSASLITNALGPAIAEPSIPLVGAATVFAGAGLVALAGVPLWLRLPVDAPAPARRRAQAAATDRPALPLLLLLVSVVLGIACGTVFTFHQPLALSRGITRVSDFLIAYTVAAVLVRLGFGRLIDRVGARRVAFGSFVFYGAVVAAMAGLAPGGLATMGLLFGLAHGLFFPSFLAAAYAAVPNGGRARLMALVNATYNAGYVAVAGLGIVAERAGFAPVFIPVGIVVGAAALALRPRAGPGRGA